MKSEALRPKEVGGITPGQCEIMGLAVIAENLPPLLLTAQSLASVMLRTWFLAWETKELPGSCLLF